MRIAYCIWIFYKKLILPTVVVSTLLGLLLYPNTETIASSLKWSGISYLLLTPVFHYFIYEVRNPNEYYFYYNMGLSKLVLWISTTIFGSILGLIIILL
jgi:hypothetical protein